MTTDQMNPRPRRRWLQYSIRTMLVLTLVISVPLGWLSMKLRQATLQRNAVEQIRKLGGVVVHASEEQVPDFSAITIPPKPPWFRNLLGDGVFESVTSAQFRGSDCTDAGLVHPELAENAIPYRLFWFDRGGLVSGSRQNCFGLSPPQAAFVVLLFQGLADGKPDVAEDELLKTATAKSVSELFPGIDGKSLNEPQIHPGMMSPPFRGKHPQQDWLSLFVPGDQPETWRLNVPKSVAPSPKADAAATGGLQPDSPSDDEIRKNRLVGKKHVFAVPCDYG